MSLVIKILDALAAKIFRIMPADPLGTPEGLPWQRLQPFGFRIVSRPKGDHGDFEREPGTLSRGAFHFQRGQE
jgi:hypothetical protein